MKREFLVEAGNRVTDFHDKGKGFVNYLETHIAFLTSVRNTLDEEIEKYSRLKNVVDQASTNDKAINNFGKALPQVDEDFENKIDKAFKADLNFDETEKSGVAPQ